MITIQCACGTKLKTREELAGKAVRCPKCGKPVKVTLPAGGGEKPAAAKPSAPAPVKKPVAAAAPAAKPQVPAKAQAPAKPVKKPATPPPDPGLGDFLDDDETRPTPPAKGKKPAPPADEEPDLNELFGEEETKPAAPVKGKKPTPEPEEEPDLSELFDEEEKKPAAPVKGKKPTPPAEEEPDLSELFGEDDAKPAPPAKGKKPPPSEPEADLNELFEDEGPPPPTAKSGKSLAKPSPGKKPPVLDDDDLDEEAFTAKPKGKPGARKGIQDDDELDDDDEAPARGKQPTKKRAKSNLMLYLLLGLVLAAGGGFAVWYFFFLDSPKPPPSRPLNPNVKPAEPQNHEYKSEKFPFAVTFPKVMESPRIEDKKEKTPEGAQVAMHVVAAEFADKTALIVTVSDFPAGSVKLSPKEHMEAMLRQFQLSLKGTNEKIEETKIGKHDGLSLAMKVADAKAHVRIIKIGDTVYQLTALGPSAESKEANQFLNSFKLSDGKKKENEGNQSMLRQAPRTDFHVRALSSEGPGGEAVAQVILTPRTSSVSADGDSAGRSDGPRRGRIGAIAERRHGG